MNDSVIHQSIKSLKSLFTLSVQLISQQLAFSITFAESKKKKKKKKMDPSQVSQGHPYVPQDLHLPNYTPCLLSMSNILFVFAFSSLLVVSLVWIFSGSNAFFPTIILNFLISIVSRNGF